MAYPREPLPDAAIGGVVGMVKVIEQGGVTYYDTAEDARRALAVWGYWCDGNAHEWWRIDHLDGCKVKRALIVEVAA